MSPRAACRLATLGYDAYDYAPGKVDWMAHGRPVEGTEAGRATALTLMGDEVVICALGDPADEIARRIDASPYGFALALSSSRIVLGRIRRSRLVDADGSIEAVLEPGPSTVRPHTSADDLVDRMARSEIRTFIVTNPEGVLLGVVPRDAVERSR